jgi:L-asparagine transporter-like permease
LRIGIFGFISVMWILLLIGGGIMVTVLGPISISGFGEMDFLLSSITKAIISILLVVVWILILSKLKNWIFRKEIHS